MTNPTVDIGTGITIAFTTSSFSAEITNVTLPASSRESHQTSHQGTTTNHTYQPGDLVDNGELVFDMNFDMSLTPPIAGAAETVTVTAPAGAAWDFSGFMTNYAPQSTFENVMSCSATVKVSGAIDRDASS